MFLSLFDMLLNCEADIMVLWFWFGGEALFFCGLGFFVLFLFVGLFLFFSGGC